MTTLRTFIAGLGMVILAIPSIALANGDGLGIVGSPHDFTDNIVVGVALNIENLDGVGSVAWNTKRKEICRVCHIPHDHGQVRYGNLGLLWNHDVSTKTSWVMYGNAGGQMSDLQGIMDAAPTGPSKMCLGCHDGVSALNQYDGKSPADAGYGNGTTYLMGDYDGGFTVGNTGASLSNNHPISITYDDVNDKGLNDPTGATMDNGDTVASLLYDNKLQCSTCHDVHNKDSVGGTHLLRESTKGADGTGAGASALCLVCHDK